VLQDPHGLYIPQQKKTIEASYSQVKGSTTSTLDKKGEPLKSTTALKKKEDSPCKYALYRWLAVLILTSDI
jgi:hypothetical protein